ncbi:Uncharacterised protein [Oligella ureolytica]|uniref:hypothetical protein n=1 Tax=Oligella ureolytica TaxID=90244 RepID=UPI000E02AA08|nr:hypothetical protein [Oligella ureolytica]SUA55929.1 Uncharacterised protein [Oligella ureolytica]
MNIDVEEYADDDLAFELIEVINQRTQLAKDMIDEMSVINQALAGLSAKPDLTKGDLLPVLNLSAKAVNEGVESFNSLLPKLEKIYNKLKLKGLFDE